MPESQISCDSINSVLTVLELPNAGGTLTSQVSIYQPTVGEKDHARSD